MPLKKPPIQTPLDIIMGVIANISWLQWIKDVANHGHWVSRDPSDWDFNKDNLTEDGTWYSLDLSSIVPKGATMVRFRIDLEDNAAGSFIQFKKNGQTNSKNSQILYTQVADIMNSADFVIECDEDQKVEYAATSTVFTTINISIRGWWI